MNVVIRPDADAVTEFAYSVVRDRLVRKGYRVLGLPTGGTPLRLYDALAEGYRAGDLDFSDVVTFTLVVAHTRDGRSVDDTAFLMQISPSLVRVYRELYERYNTPEYRERIDGIIATVKRCGFRPSQLEQESEPNEAKKGGPRR